MSIKPSAKSRTRRSPEASRENILAAAEALLVERGPQHLKLADVAKAAGVANATVLHHFGSIDGVQAALMDRMIGQLVETLVAIDSHGDDVHELERAGMQALFDAFESRGAARLAAWLELSGEARRLTGVAPAFLAVQAQHLDRAEEWSVTDAQDHMLVSVIVALGAGLFGPTLATIMGIAPERVRMLAMDVLRAKSDELIAAAKPPPKRQR